MQSTRCNMPVLWVSPACYTSTPCATNVACKQAWTRCRRNNKGPIPLSTLQRLLLLEALGPVLHRLSRTAPESESVWDLNVMIRKEQTIHSKHEPCGVKSDAWISPSSNPASSPEKNGTTDNALTTALYATTSDASASPWLLSQALHVLHTRLSSGPRRPRIQIVTCARCAHILKDGVAA